MPELTKHTARICESCLTWERFVTSSSDPNVNYTVRYGRLRGSAGPVFGYTCTCPAFVYRGGECKHIRAVADERCGWGEEAFTGSVPQSAGALKKETCPKCGERTHVIEVAV